MWTTITETTYLISIILFILGLKRLSHPETARTGNLVAAGGMGLAILFTLVVPVEGASNNYLWIAGGILLGSAIGITAAKKVLMTKMPEMVSLFNGLGGACSMLIAFVEIYNLEAGDSLGNGAGFTTLFALFIGSISFTGSFVAWGKLDGFLRDNLRLPAPQVINGLLLLVILALAGYLMWLPGVNLALAVLLLALSLVYGVTFVTPIGGGDMPVVISLLNSFTGLGAAGAGLIYGNNVMVIGGILVGASGTILTVLMCKAMNRSLLNVVIGGFGGGGTSSGSSREQVAKETTPADLAIQLKYAQKVMIVPGYGLAVAQAQHTCHEMEKLLTEEGVQVKYAIHPVAGRMPGHMNVLLAEADVDYSNLADLEEANKEMPAVDMVLVIGANDVVNPAAREDSASPIYGMPILDVEMAKGVTVLKRSMSTGYAGIQNPLFFGEKTKMLFGDAKASLNKITDEIGNA